MKVLCEFTWNENKFRIICVENKEEFEIKMQRQINIDNKIVDATGNPINMVLEKNKIMLWKDVNNVHIQDAMIGLIDLNMCFSYEMFSKKLTSEYLNKIKGKLNIFNKIVESIEKEFNNCMEEKYES